MRRRYAGGPLLLPRPNIAPWSSAILAAALLATAGLVAYANSLSHPFPAGDDLAITANTTIRDIRQLGVVLSPPAETPVAHRPLVNLTYALNYALGGLDVRGYRLGTLVVHLLAACTLFGLVRRALLLEVLAPRFETHATGVAVAASLLWMLHPLHTGVVNVASHRAAALAGLLTLVALYAAVRALSASRALWYTVAIAASIAAVASKEAAVTIPVVVVLFDRTFVFDSFRAAWRHRRGLYAGLAVTWLVFLALVGSGEGTASGAAAGVERWTYLLHQAPIQIDYLRLSIWPVGLVADYGLPTPLSLSDVAGPLVLLGVLAAGVLVSLAVAPRAGFLGACWFIALVPTSSVIPIATEAGAERRLYLSLAAFVVFATCASYRIGARLTTESGRRGPELAGPAVGVALVAIVAGWFAAGVVQRNREYRTPGVACADCRTTALFNRGDDAGALQDSNR